MEPNERTTEQLVFIGLFNTLSESGNSESVFAKNSDVVDVYDWCMNNEDEPATFVKVNTFYDIMAGLRGIII